MAGVSEPTVLVTGCGAPGFPGTLWSLRSDDGLDGRVVGTDVRTEQAGRYLADSFHRVPAADDGAFVDELVDVCATEAVDVVLPQVTRELPVLAAERSRFEAVGATVAVPSADAVERANDKGTLIDVCRDLRVPHPETATVETGAQLEGACRELGYPGRPVVVKPPDSNGSRGVRVLDADRDRKRAFYEEKPTGLYARLEDLRETLGERFPRLLAMEHLPGQEYTVDAFRRSGGGEVVAVPRRRESVRSGISFRAGLEEHEEIIEHARRLARELDLAYAFGFQFKLDRRGRPKILECNPRVQGTMVASTIAGANVVAASVRDALGEPLPRLEPAWDRSFYRYWGGVGVGGQGLVGNVGELE